MCRDNGLEISRPDLQEHFFKRTGRNQLCSNRYTNVRDLIRRQDRQKICVICFLLFVCFCFVLFCFVLLFRFVFCVCVCFFLLFSVLCPAGEPARASAYKKKQEANEERNSRVRVAVLFVSY